MQKPSKRKFHRGGVTSQRCERARADKGTAGDFPGVASKSRSSQGVSKDAWIVKKEESERVPRDFPVRREGWSHLGWQSRGGYWRTLEGKPVERGDRRCPRKGRLGGVLQAGVGEESSLHIAGFAWPEGEGRGGDVPTATCHQDRLERRGRV